MLSVVASDDSKLVVRDLPETLTATFYQDETPTDTDGTVNIAITDEAGDTVVASTAATSAGSGVYTYNLPAQTQLNHLVAKWSGSWSALAATFTTIHDVVGDFYTTPSEVRELDLIAGETTVYPTARLHQAIDFATQLIQDGTDQTTTNWAIRTNGQIVRDEGTFDFTHPGQIIVVEAEYGLSQTAKADIAWAARTLARHYQLELESRIPDRALTLTDGVGQIQLWS